MADTHTGRTSFSGVVLTGGKSTRMGRDKSLLPVDGVPMARRVADALTAAGATSVVCVGGDSVTLHALELDVIDDEHPGEGPLGGFLTGLAWATEAITVVAPCDLRTPAAESFRVLVRALANSEALAAVPIVDGAWRALPAALRTSSHPELARVFAAGERAFHRAIGQLTFVAVDAGALEDADTPEELPGRR